MGRKNKKLVLKPNQVDLGYGFILTTVKHPIGDVNGDIEGYLSYHGEELNIDNIRFYSEITEAVKDFNLRLIPEYISKNNIKVFKYLDDEMMFNFTKEYLINNKDKITYGKVIDVIEILKEDGYKIPSNEDNVQVGNLLDFYSCVNRLSREFKKHLNMFGFTSDRNVSITTDHGSFNKHLKCRNIIFTRYPWSNGFKAISAINDFITFTDNDLSKEIDMNTLKRISPETQQHLKGVLSLFNKLNLRTKQALEDLDYDKLRKEFKTHIKEHRNELIKVWSKRKPSGYGIYP